MKIKRPLSLLLAVLMLGGSLVSCATDGDNDAADIGTLTPRLSQRRKPRSAIICRII